VAIFQCHPIAAPYDLEIKEYTCIDLTRYLVSTSVLNVVADVAILVLPLRILWTLQLPTSRKVSLSFVFLLGTFTIAISTVRTVAVSRLIVTDPTWDLVPLELYSSLEVDSGIICACLPAMAPLLQRFFGRSMTGRSDYKNDSSLKRNQWPTTKRSLVNDGSFTQLHSDDPSKFAGASPPPIFTAVHGKSSAAQGDDLEMDNIYVTTEVVVD